MGPMLEYVLVLCIAHVSVRPMEHLHCVYMRMHGCMHLFVSSMCSQHVCVFPVICMIEAVCMCIFCICMTVVW